MLKVWRYYKICNRSNFDQTKCSWNLPRHSRPHYAVFRSRVYRPNYRLSFRDHTCICMCWKSHLNAWIWRPGTMLLLSSPGKWYGQWISWCVTWEQMGFLMALDGLMVLYLVSIWTGHSYVCPITPRGLKTLFCSVCMKRLPRPFPLWTDVGISTIYPPLLPVCQHMAVYTVLERPFNLLPNC